MLFDSDSVTLKPQFKINTSTGLMSIYADISPMSLSGVSDLFPTIGMGKTLIAILLVLSMAKGQSKVLACCGMENPLHFHLTIIRAFSGLCRYKAR